ARRASRMSVGSQTPDRASAPRRAFHRWLPRRPSFASLTWPACSRLRANIPAAVVLLLEVGDNALQEPDHALALCPRRGAPLVATRALVRDLELESGQ